MRHMQHEDWIDRYKGMLIILVVMGHVFGGGYHLVQGSSQQFLHYCFRVIYSFHMPAFFFLAGITWRQKEDEEFSAFFIKKVRRLIVPYIVFGVFSSVVFCLVAGSADFSAQEVTTTSHYEGLFHASFITCMLGLLHGGGWPQGEGFQMNTVLWFLPCLFSVEVIYWWLRKLRIAEGVRILPLGILCFALAIVCSRYVSGLPWGLSVAPKYLPFVFLGAECFSLRESKCFKRHGVVSAFILLSVTAVYSIAVCLLPNPWIMVENWRWWMVFMPLAMIGCVLSACLSQIMKWRGFAICGAASMGIMLVHKFPVMFFELKLPIVRQVMARGIGGALIGCSAVALVSLALSWTVSALSRRWIPWVLGEGRRK